MRNFLALDASTVTAASNSSKPIQISNAGMTCATAFNIELAQSSEPARHHELLASVPAPK